MGCYLMVTFYIAATLYDKKSLVTFEPANFNREGAQRNSLMAQNQTIIVDQPKIKEQELTSPDQSNSHTAAVCAIAIHEERYIDEWSDYNLAIGFQRLYIFDNSKNFTLNSWKRQRNDKRITVIHHPIQNGHVAPQFTAYNNCISRARRDGFYWAAFFDLDEYLVLKKHRYVSEFLEEHCTTGSIGISWRVFGTSNHSLYQPIPVLKRFQHYTPNHPSNLIIKSIVRVQDFERASNPHFMILRKGFRNKNTNGQTIEEASIDPVYDIAVFHHYSIKSREEFVQKRLRGRADLALNQAEIAESVKEAIQGDLDVGIVFDDSAWKLLCDRVPHYKMYD
jgi:hypothetical protein